MALKEIQESSPKLVSVSRFLPYEGVPHAGGEYVRRHLSALVRHYDLRLLTLASSDNVDHLAKVSPSAAEVTFVDVQRTRFRRWIHVLEPIYKALAGASLGLGAEFAIRRDAAFRNAVADADIVEFQWTEAANLSKFVRRNALSARQVLIIHDVLTQRWLRAARGSSRQRDRIYFRARAVTSYLAEKRAFRRVDDVIAFSSKDADMVLRIAPKTRVHVVNPPLEEKGMTDHRISRNVATRNSILFTGALGRPENHDAMMWFLLSIWPKVCVARPDASIIIAGSSPRKELLELAETTTNVSVTGYVSDLGEYYRRACLVVVPLRFGAGVKFKTITAMLWGAPVVSTSVGGEGIGDPGKFFALTDNEDDFAQAIIAALDNPDRSQDQARRTREWALGQYGMRAFENRLDGIYTINRNVG